ncbi:TIGR02281 family clan AA aspartic protease [Chakrabartia godavariana]|nr:TIGR02281 family clan AA aspartic protease [Chakrabartia godavariana]
MTDQTGSLIYAVLLLVLVGSSLLARRLPLGETLKMVLTWALIFAALFVLFTFRSDLKIVWDRVAVELGLESATQKDGTLRVPRDAKGHFSVTARVNGRDIRFMIDSGATTTSMSLADAHAAAVDVSEAGFPVIVETANGTAEMRRARVSRLSVGPIQREDVAILVSDTLGDTNLLGMNFLNTLTGWRVEGDTLVLNP